MNTIFLDIDGVLNSTSWNKSHTKEISNGILIDFEKVILLEQLVKDTDSQIILHSGWKYWFDEDINPKRIESQNLLYLFSKVGLSISGFTPNLATSNIIANKTFSLIKAEEILLWLFNHPTNAWVVIDDLDLNNCTVKKHQIITDSNIGLTVADINRAKNLLYKQRL